MRHPTLPTVLLVRSTPVINLSAIPLFPSKFTAARSVAMENGRLFLTRAYSAIESLHVAADLGVGIAQKVLCIVVQCPRKEGHICDKTVFRITVCKVAIGRRIAQ